MEAMQLDLANVQPGSVEDLAMLSELLRIACDAGHALHERAMDKLRAGGAACADKVLTSLEAAIADNACDNKENVCDDARQCQETSAVQEDVLWLAKIFHSLDVIFLFLYAEMLPAGRSVLGRIYSLLLRTYFMSLLPQDAMLKDSKELFDVWKGVRKGIFVLGQAISVLLVTAVHCSDSGRLAGDVALGANLDGIDESNAVFTLALSVYDRKWNDCDAACSKSIYMALQWTIDILKSPYCFINSSAAIDELSTVASAMQYPNAIGIRSVFRDLLLRIVFVYERLDGGRVMGSLMTALGLAHRSSRTLCDSLWTSNEERSALSAFLTECLCGDAACWNAPFVFMLRCIADCPMGAQYVGDILSRIPVLPLPRTPDRHCVSELSEDIALLLEVKRPLLVSLAQSVGILLAPCITGSQKHTDSLVVWNVVWSGWELVFRLLESSADNDLKCELIILVSVVLQNGYHLPSPKIDALFERSKADALHETLAATLRGTADAGCTPHILFHLFKSLSLLFSQSSVDPQILADLDLLSDSPRGLFYLLSPECLQAPPLNVATALWGAFLELCTVCVRAVPKDRLIAFVDALLSYSTLSVLFGDRLFVKAFGGFLLQNQFASECAPLVKKYSLSKAFLQALPEGIDGAIACQRHVSDPLDPSDVHCLFAGEREQYEQLLSIIVAGGHILDSYCYAQIAKGCRRVVLDAVACSDKHLNQLRIHGLLENIVDRTDSVVFLAAVWELFADKDSSRLRRALEKRKDFVLDTFRRRGDATEASLRFLLLADPAAVDLETLSGLLDERPHLAAAIVAAAPSSEPKDAKAFREMVVQVLKKTLQPHCVDSELIGAAIQRLQIGPSRDILPYITCHLELLQFFSSPDSIFKELLTQAEETIQETILPQLHRSPELILFVAAKIPPEDGADTVRLMTRHCMLPLFFSKAALLHPLTPIVLSAHPLVLARELLSMGILEACQEVGSPGLVDCLLSCVDQAPDRITALLHNADVRLARLEDSKLLELVVRLQRTRCIQATVYVRGLGEALLSLVRQYALGPRADGERGCMLALTALQEMDVRVPEPVLKRLCESPIASFVRLLD